MPECKLWLSMNHKPRIFDDSYGFWRSVRLIPFRRQFKDDADTELTETLKAEAPGILAWAVQACLDWQAEGLAPPDDVREETQVWQRESDPLAEFFDVRCVEIDGYSAGRELWQGYLDYANENGIPEKERVSHRFFGLRLGEKYKKERKWLSGTTQLCYKGVGLRNE